MVVDPACSVLVDETRSSDVAVYRDRRYYFCSAECRAAFARNPSAYLPLQAPGVVPGRATTTGRWRLSARYLPLGLGGLVPALAGCALVCGGVPGERLSGIGLVAVGLIVVIGVAFS